MNGAATCPTDGPKPYLHQSGAAVVAAMHAGVQIGSPRRHLQISQQGPVQLPQDLAPTGHAQLHICIAAQSDQRGGDTLQRLGAAGRALDGNQSHERSRTRPRHLGLAQAFPLKLEAHRDKSHVPTCKHACQHECVGTPLSSRQGGQ